MSEVQIKVPDIGDFKDVAVIELLVKPGDAVQEEQSLVTVESDKASMEIPCSQAGIVRQVLLECGAAETTDQEKTVDQLLAEACGVFITQSTTGITPVGSIDGKSAGTTGVPAMKKAVLAYQSAAAGRAAA